MGNWAGILIGWTLVPLCCLVTTKMISHLKPNWPKTVRYFAMVYVVIGAVFATVVIGEDVVDPFSNATVKETPVQFITFIIVTAIWPIYIPAIPFFVSCAIEILTHDLTC